MKKWLLTSIMLLCSLSLLLPEESRQRRIGSLNLQNGSISYTLEYDTGNDEWSSYIMQKTEMYLPAVKKYLGIPLPRTEPFKIHGRDEVYYDRPDPGKYGTRVGGVNFWDYIGIEYGLTETGKPALLLHELGHFWYGSQYMPGLKKSIGLSKAS